MNKKYIVIAGFIHSRNDEGKHWIDCLELCRLYRVDPRECVLVGEGDRYKLLGLSSEDLIVLQPRNDGHYVRPDEDA